MKKQKVYQEATILKFMSPEEYSAFVEKYMANKKWARMARPVSDEDRQMLADYKAKLSLKELSDKYKCSVGKIQHSILKALAE